MGQTLASMTGYGRVTGAALDCTFQIEMKSINARGLDVRLRLAPGLEMLEPLLRTKLAGRLSRGAITVSINLQREAIGGELVVNEAALGTVLEAMERLRDKIVAKPPRLDGVLALKGVLETREALMTPGTAQTLQDALLAASDDCLDALIASRVGEGQRLAGVLRGQVDRIESLTRAADNHPSRTREAVLARLRQHVEELLEIGGGLSEERLHQEAVLLAGKADIREELDRLAAHVGAARQLICDGGSVGRKMDFLSQEFNREANTLCSKSNAVELTAIGLDLKAVIDQMREQIQNVE